MTRPLRPPPVRPVVPPSQSPDKPRTTWAELLGKPATAAAAGVLVAVTDIVGEAAAVRKFITSISSVVSWSALALADLPVNTTGTRKFLRSVASGAAVWDVLTAPDVGAGTFPAGTFAFTDGLSIGKTLRVRGSIGADIYAADATNDSIVVGNGATSPLFTTGNLASGCVLVGDEVTDGNIGLFLFAAAYGTRMIGQLGASFSDVPGGAGTVNIIMSAGKLAVENNSGASRTLTPMVFRVRTQ